MDNKQIYLVQNKNPPQNQNKGENVSCNSKYSDQNKNLNESSMVTSVSSVNTKKNTQHTNYKTPKKKKFSHSDAQAQKPQARQRQKQSGK